MSSTTAAAASSEQGVLVNPTSVASFSVQPAANTGIIHPTASEEAVTTTPNNDNLIIANPGSSNVNLASNSTVSVPPSVQLLKIHEEQAIAAHKTDVSLMTETLSTAVNTVRGSNSTTVYDEANWPSLSATSAPIKSSSVWGSRSGAELVRQAAQATTPIGVVGDRLITLPTAANIASTPFTGVQPVQQPQLKFAGIITQVVELSAAQQLQKREFGFKTTTSDIVKRIKEKTNTQIQVSTANVSGTTTFLIKGKADDVLRAKRELLSNFAIKTEIRIQIPVSVRRFILGARGETLKSISHRTGTRIQLPPRQGEPHEEKTSELDYDEEEEQMTITIEGDEEGINLAKADIEAIVNEKTSKKVVKITDIEHHFYPLIAGAYGQRLQQLQQESGAKIHIPPYIVSFDNEGHEGNNTRDNCIVVSGERDAVRKAIEMLKDRHEELKSTTATTKTTVPKRQHKYLIGTKGANLQDILESTECSIELSPPSDPSEEVVIRGPSRNHWKAMQAVSEKANSIHVETLDIANIHKTENPIEHAKNVLKYLWNRSKLRKIEAETNIQIMVPKGFPLDKGIVLEFVGKVVSDVEKARKEVMELVKNLPPISFTIVSIEPHLHRHIIGRKGQNLQRVKETYGVEIIVPDEKDESPDILIVFEGKEGDEIPTEKKKKEAHVKDVLDNAKQELIKAGQDASDFATHTLTIPVRFHRHIIGPRGVTLNSITGGSDAPVSVKFGSSRTGAAERSANAEGKKATTIPISDDIVVIKGPTEEVNRVVKEINKVVEDAKHIEIMNSYTIDFTFPAQYSAHVIGKGGSHVTRLKENLNVKIDIEGGAKGEEKKTHPGENVKVTIQGRKDNVEEAKAKILDLVDKLQDATILRLNVPAEYHKSLIGVGGRYVKRLEEKYNVHIRFPKNKESTEEAEDDSEAQKFDEVIIKGGRRGAADAKAEMMELLEYEREHDNSLIFTIPAIYLPHVVGRGGVKITEIKDDTFTRIDLGRSEPSPDNPDEQIVNVVIHGTKQDIVKAQEAILQIVHELESQTTITINIDPQHHKYLIGPGGSRIREIVAKAGGPDEKSSQAGIVKFPRHGSNSDEVILKGDKNIVEKVKIELEKLVEEQNNLVVDLIEIPRIQHPQIIGRNGTSLRDLQHRFNVEIQFPGSRAYNDTHLSSDVKVEIENSDEAVKIIGKKENIEAAKTEILSKIRHIHTVNVPRKYHCAIAANGATMRKLRNEYGVLVDHGNEVPPETKPQTKKPNGNGIAAKRIDDEDENSDKDYGGELNWELVENDDNEEEGEIPWNLKGEKKQVERAEKYVNELLEETRNFTHTAFFTVPQHLHRHIIGRGGATIQRIRSESGCRIDVPKSNDDEIVIVTGSVNGVDEARTLMLEVIERANR